MGGIVWIGSSRSHNLEEGTIQLSWKTISVPAAITALACHNDILAVGERNGDIHVYLDVFKALEKNQTPVETILRWHHSPVASLELSQNGKLS